MTKKDAQIPLIKMYEWMEAEKKLGSDNPDRVVLATCSPEGIPHSRIVAIREITPQGIIFFTQRSSRKVTELKNNPSASMTLWLALQQRQIILDGIVQPLTDKENEKFWVTLSRERQLRFSAYAPTSGQIIDSLSVLEHQLDMLTEQFLGEEIPMSNHYCGLHLIVETMYFYTLRDRIFSESLKYTRCHNAWDKQLVSP